MIRAIFAAWFALIAATGAFAQSLGQAPGAGYVPLSDSVNSWKWSPLTGGGGANGSAVPALMATNASGLNTTATGTISAGSTSLTLTGAWDIQQGQGVWIPKAGPNATAAAPTISGVTVNANSTISVTFSGTPAVGGGTISIQVACTSACGGSSFNGAGQTVTYTTVAGDTPTWLGWKLANLAATNNAFANATGAGVYLTWDTYPLQNSNQIRVQQIATNPPITLTLTSTDANITLAQSAVIGASSTVAYSVMGRDANGGFSVPSAVTNAVNSNDPTLGGNALGAIRYNRNPALGGTNTVKWTPGANNIDIVVCRNNVAVAILPASQGTTGFVDEGQPVGAGSTIASGWLDAPSCTAVASQPAPLITTAATVAGTTVTLADPAVNAVTGGTIAHDDGAALQAMLTTGCHRTGSGTGIDAYMVIPVGNYNIHQMLTCIGSNGSAVFLQGQGGLQRIGDRSGTFISYYGRGDQAILRLDGVNGSTLQDFLLYGNYIARYALWANSPTAIAMSGNHFNRLGLWRPNHAVDSAGAFFGPNTGVCAGAGQLSEQFFQALYIFQDLGSRAGFDSACGGNQKNFSFIDLQIVGFHNAVLGPGTGLWSFVHSILGNQADALFSGISNLTVNGLESEAMPNAMLTTIASSGNSYNFQYFNNVGFNTPPPSPGFFAISATSLPFTITNSVFGAGTYQGEYRINGSFTTATWPMISINNFYESSTSLPIYVAGNRNGLPPFTPNNGRFLFSVGVSSIGDTGGPLVPSGSNSFVQSTVAFSPGDGVGGNNLRDQLYVRQWITNAGNAPANTIDWYGSGIRSRAMADPGLPTVTVLGTPGALTCKYQIAFRDASGAHTTALSAVPTTPPSGMVTTCASPRNNQITSGIAPQGAYFMDVVDQVSGLLVGTANITTPGVLGTGGQNWIFKDTGQTQTTYSPPTTFNNTGQMQADRGIITTPLTVATLPTCTAVTQGMRAFVTDQNTAVAYHGAVTGSGTTKQSVMCDGTAWYQD